MTATRDELLSTCKRRYRLAEIAGLPQPVRIQSLSEGERATIETKLSGSDLSKLRAALVVRCVVDEDGDRLFADEDVDQVLEMDSTIVSEISDAIQDHCATAEIEELAKNSNGTPGDALLSA